VRIAAEARVPPTVGSWHRETHAFVALAKRSPEKAAPSMEAFVTHPVWWVRMYAAGAAAAAGDTLRLEKLAYDTNDNVREAALTPWRRLKKADADPAILDALERTDVQLVHAAAGFLKDSPKSERTYKALMGALGRLTKEGKETSRDARTMIFEALAIHGSTENANELVPYLKDFDPKVAQKAAELITRWTGKAAVAAPVPYTRGWPQEYKDLRQCVSVQMVNAGTFRMVMMPAAAPIAVDHFLKLALKDKYYDGLTIHRVVPNFVLQGGSPNANEYSGAKEFMRDEIFARNGRGTVGLSTRGRNTADAQFFINLVDNNRLNPDYTVFARIPAEDLNVVDRIQEGDVMRTINPTKCGS
jgi:cyclophilin family peptidyl-prolyl cis-trans isomerase